MMNKDDNTSLKQQANELGLAFDKKRKIYKAIFLLIVLIVVVGLMTTIIVLFKDATISSIRRSAIVLTIIFTLFCYYASDVIVCNFSKSLKAMKNELDRLNSELYPQIFATKQKKVAIKERNLVDDIKLIIGFLIFATGCILLITSSMIEDVISDEMFIAFLISGIWLVIYSFFVMFSKKLIRGMYYPTMTLLTTTIPPLLAAWVTHNGPEWIMILSTCLAAAFGLFLFSVFLYFSVYRPGKEGRQFIKDNKDLFEERESEEKEYLTEIINAKKDRARISVWRNTRHHVIIEKWIEEEPAHFEKIADLEFVEYHNAYHTAVKEIVMLYKNQDGRTEVKLEQKMRKLTEAKISELLEKIQSNDYLKDKIKMLRDDYIEIKFHKYLTVRLGEEYCEYFNTHWHPSDNEDAAEFIDELMNERIIFFKNRLTRRKKQYDGYYLDRLLKTKNKKFCRVYSAMKIYIDK